MEKLCSLFSWSYRFCGELSVFIVGAIDWKIHRVQGGRFWKSSRVEHAERCRDSYTLQQDSVGRGQTQSRSAALTRLRELNGSFVKLLRQYDMFVFTPRCVSAALHFLPTDQHPVRQKSLCVPNRRTRTAQSRGRPRGHVRWDTHSCCCFSCRYMESFCSAGIQVKTQSAFKVMKLECKTHLLHATQFIVTILSGSSSGQMYVVTC